MFSYDLCRWLDHNLLVPQGSVVWVRLPSGELVGVESLSIDTDENLVIHTRSAPVPPAVETDSEPPPCSHKPKDDEEACMHRLCVECQHTIVWDIMNNAWVLLADWNAMERERSNRG